MRVQLAYGRHDLEVELPDDRVTVVAPRHAPPLPDEPAAIRAALRAPLGSLPLHARVRADDTVAIVFSDFTRAQPRDRILPVLLDELALSGVPPERITLFNATGTHRPNSAAELAEMLGPAVHGRCRVVQHDCRDTARLARLAPTGGAAGGRDAFINAEFLRAGVKILTGFIEPHFFAGFTGGPKAIMPGLAGLDTVLANHAAPLLADPCATWGVTRGNPVWQEMLDVALRAGPSFLLDVALDDRRRITGVFAGDLACAHSAGTRFVGETALAPLPGPFDLVLTTNSGFPLDRNLYQCVKGMSAAARVVKPGGAIVVVAACDDGLPAESGYATLLREARDPRDLLARVQMPGFAHPDQWQAQIQALIQQRAEVHLFSDGLTAAEIRAAHLIPCRSIGETVARLLAARGSAASLCVLPQGPLTIPTLQAAPACPPGPAA